MNRVKNCGIAPHKAFYSLADGQEVRGKLDTYLDKKMQEWKETVTYAEHLESKDLNSAWYRRHIIEHVWRIRLSRSAHCKALHAITKVSPEAAQLYAEYQADEIAIGVTEEELLNTEPFLATRLLQGFFYFITEHEDPIGVVASSYLVEYTTAKLTPKQISSMKETLGEDEIKGQLAHINTDLGDDHAGEMWRILRLLIRNEQDVEKVLRYFDDIQSILAMYFEELYKETVDNDKAA
jgi:hypothetical protein